MSPSGWCTPAPGARERLVDHQECQRRLGDGRLTGCACPDHTPKAA